MRSIQLLTKNEGVMETSSIHVCDDWNTAILSDHESPIIF